MEIMSNFNDNWIMIRLLKILIKKQNYFQIWYNS